MGIFYDELAIIFEKPSTKSNIELKFHGGHSSIHVERRHPDRRLALFLIEVPKLSGEYMEWLAFKDLLSAIIDN